MVRRAGVNVVRLVVARVAFAEDDANQVMRTERQIALPHGRADFVVGLRYEVADVTGGTRVSIGLKRVNSGPNPTITTFR